MKGLSKQLLFLVTLFLFFLILGSFLSIRESFQNTNPNLVELVNSSTSCQNFCGPPAKCSITGEQCFADTDCTGCKPIINPNPPTTPDVRGLNDAGILTDSTTPTYSVLTTDIGSRAAFYKDKGRNFYPPKYFQGVNQWRPAFDNKIQLYNKKYNPNIEFQKFIPIYPKRPTLSGEFIDNGPLAANDYLN
jgi:hypothetical protein